jgi:hypothetical protein
MRIASLGHESEIQQCKNSAMLVFEWNLWDKIEILPGIQSSRDTKFKVWNLWRMEPDCGTIPSTV